VAALDVLISEKHIEKVSSKYELIKKLLTCDNYKIEGKGLLLSLNLHSSELNFKCIEKCIEKGLITDWFLFADHKLRIAPPLNISEADIIKACQIIRSSIEELQAK